MMIKNGYFRYKNSKKYILNDINLTIKPKQVNIILGLNGAGKTTLFDLIAGILKRPEGFIEMPSPKETIYQVQGVPFLSSLKGKHIVRLFLKTDKDYKGEKIEPASLLTEADNDRELNKVNHLWNMEFGQMSPGERRWLIVSCICKINRKVYIFDEPTSGVDPNSRISILKKIKELAVNKTVLYSTHIMHELELLDGNICVLHEGRIRFEGSYQQFLKAANTENPEKAFYFFTEKNGLLHEIKNME